MVALLSPQTIRPLLGLRRIVHRYYDNIDVSIEKQKHERFE